jgi:hypothetical protein
MGRKSHWDVRVFAVIMLLLLPSVSLLDGAKDAIQERLNFITRNDSEALKEAINLIPNYASVAAPNYSLPALSGRPKLFYIQYMHMYRLAKPEYYLFDRNRTRITTNRALQVQYQELLEKVSCSIDYQKIWQRDEYFIVRRID